MRENPLDKLVATRKKQRRNCIIIIADRNSETGTGKSTLALTLAKRYDPKFGIDNVIFDVFDFIKEVSETKKRRRGAWYVLDEVGVYLDARRSMSKGNVGFTQLLQIFREEQISLVATLPTTTVLDARVRELADVVFLVNNRGYATGYRIAINPFSLQHNILMHKFMCMRWSHLDGTPLWDGYKKKKREFLRNKYAKLLGAKTKTTKKKVTKKEKILKLLKKGVKSSKEIAKEVGTTRTYVHQVAYSSR
ncbi:MAG: hypothetical protein ACXQTR_04985 [Candidatus Methanospirareceae archaeon]